MLNIGSHAMLCYINIHPTPDTDLSKPSKLNNFLFNFGYRGNFFSLFLMNIGSDESILRGDDGTRLNQLLFVKIEERFRCIIS